MKQRVLNTFPLVVLVALLLFPTLGCQTQSNKPTTASAATQQPVRFKAGDLDIVAAYFPPAKLPSMKLLKVREESISTDTVLAMFKFNKKAVRGRNAPEIGGYQYIMSGPHNGLKYTESVTIKPYNNIVYQRDSRIRYSKQDPHFSEKRARRMVDRFIKAHGGLPKDAVVASIEPSATDQIKQGNGTKQIVHQYMVTYVNRNYNSYPVRGANRISVTVDDEGVIRYERFWRTVRGATGKPVKLIDPKVAVSGALKLILSSPQYRTHGVFSSGVVDLYKIELVYFSPEPRKRVDRLRPAYKISFLSTGLVAFADAVTGEGVNIAYNDTDAGIKSWEKDRIRAAKLIAEFKSKNKITSRAPKRPLSSTHYVWAGGDSPDFWKELPIYMREKRVLNSEEVTKLCELFGTKEPLPIGDKNFYHFGSAKKANLKPGEDYTFQTGKEGANFTFELVDWMNWSAKHPQLPDTEAAKAAAIAFLKPRGLLPAEVGVIEVSVQHAEYGQPGHQLVTAPAVWVFFQGKVDGYPSIGPDGRPDPYSWVGLGIGVGGKILTAHGMLPVEPKRIVKPLRSIEDALAEANQSPCSSNSDGNFCRSNFAGSGDSPVVGPDLKWIKPVIFEYKIISAELAYQVRISTSGEVYFGPVYVFTIADTHNNRPNKLTVPAAIP